MLPKDRPVVELLKSLALRTVVSTWPTNMITGEESCWAI
jgi:hypothetical protein